MAQGFWKYSRLSPGNWSLKAKVTSSFMAVVLCISLALSLLYYQHQSEQYKQHLIITNQNDVDYLMGNIEKQLRLCENLSNWIFVNHSLQSILIRDYSRDISRYSIDALTTDRMITDQLASSAVGRYIVFLIITGRNGAVLKSSNDAYYVEDLSGEKWYSDGLSQGGRLYWPGIYENPARYRSTRLILPISRPVIYSGTRAEIGWHVLAFSPALISDVFEDYRMDSSRSVVVLDRGGRTVFHQDQNMIGQVTEYPFTDLGDGSHFVELDEKQVLVTSKHSEYSGMTLLLIHSLQSLETQAAFTGIVLLVIVTITAAMFLLLVYYLSKRLTKPLEKILDRMHSISGGDFTVDTSIEGSDEMGLIGRGVNEMSANIVYLMGESIKHEQERIELEYQVLLNQINPHFVYNVLNSIKVMADIQKIEGISEMASSLGALLGEISKGTQEQVTIRRELELLDRYLYLQQIRRCGLLTVRYDIPEELKDCLIPRFTLQPLAENAVYHGLDKKDRMGTIDISIREENVDLVVIMLDNGAGIPPERIETLLAQTDEGDKKQLTHVGVSNVDKRVKLFNGGEGGLYIESEEGSYTKVTVWLRKKVH